MSSGRIEIGGRGRGLSSPVSATSAAMALSSSSFPPFPMATVFSLRFEEALLKKGFGTAVKVGRTLKGVIEEAVLVWAEGDANEELSKLYLMTDSPKSTINVRVIGIFCAMCNAWQECRVDDRNKRFESDFPVPLVNLNELVFLT